MTMQKFLLALAALACAILPTACSSNLSDSSSFFTPVEKSNLRLPSVPILVSDPFFSIWSPSDGLMKESVEHWSAAKKPLIGAIRVDGTVYRFLGENHLDLKTILPLAAEEEWTAQVSRRVSDNRWMQPDYNCVGWTTETGAFGMPNDYPDVKTKWGEVGENIYIRREVELSEDDAKGTYFVYYNHDDFFEMYINGTKIIDTGHVWGKFSRKLTDEEVALLKPGKNVIAAHCYNQDGGAFVDFGLSRVKDGSVKFDTEAVQTSCNVLATSSYYTFSCGPVDLDLVFTAPQIYDDLDLLSTPINYVSYRAKANDNKEHSVQIYFETTPDMATNSEKQPTEATAFSKNGINYLKAGTINQPYCGKSGDLVCCDWGYVYMAANSNKGRLALGDYFGMKSAFIDNGEIAEGETSVRSYTRAEKPAMAYCEDLGTVSGTQSADNFIMIGYDDVYSIEYMHERRKGYWAHDGKVSITDAFENMSKNYASIMTRCREVDQQIYSDGLEAGGVKYAEILSGSYRQVMSAHKLFTDNDGNLLWFSKENNSNGCVNTVDLTYPSAPLFLVYNPDLEKAMMTSIFEYSRTGRWNKPFAAHDLGQYPLANGQVYGGDMPVEESGNMLILAAAIARAEGNAEYSKKYWDILTTWVDYLVENGLDPTNQLCTDDFAGHWAHNANLSAKAIMGVQAYADLADMLGDKDAAEKYAATAKEMATKWKEMAADGGDHYRLAFDRPDTWSQKYNIIWDVVWGKGLFGDVAETEVAYYLTKQNPYGLPLDCRKEYTKNDWTLWSASLASSQDDFEKIVDPIYNFINSCETRVPIRDWHHTEEPTWVSFRARSVIGGFWMQVLKHKTSAK